MTPVNSLKEMPIEKEYQKNKDISSQDIAKLRQWLTTQAHLPANHLTDLDLILVFHCCKRSFAVAQEVLDLHFTLKTLFKAYFKDRKIDDVLISTLNLVLFAMLPTPSNEGDAVMYVRLVDDDPKKFDFTSWIRTTFMVIDYHQYIEGTWPGLVLVLDFEGVTIRHITKIDLQNLKQLLYYLQEAMLLNLKGLHFINAPSFIDTLLIMMKPFMKKELLEAFHIHTVGSKTLEKFVPTAALPKEAGGNYKSLKECQDETILKMKHSGEYFKQENNKRVNEALRAGRAKTISDIFGGVEGSFKSLAID